MPALSFRNSFTSDSGSLPLPSAPASAFCSASRRRKVVGYMLACAIREIKAKPWTKSSAFNCFMNFSRMAYRPAVRTIAAPIKTQVTTYTEREVPQSQQTILDISIHRECFPCFLIAYIPFPIRQESHSFLRYPSNALSRKERNSTQGFGHGIYMQKRSV